MTSRSQTTKRNKPDNSGVADEPEEMSISQLAELLMEKMERTKTEISKQFKEEMLVMKTEIKTEIDLIRSGLQQTITDLSISVSRNTESIQLNTESIARSSCTNDLLMRGIPFVQGENLYKYFEKLCDHLGYAGMVPLVDMRRLSRATMVAGKAYIVMIQFAITNQRNDFYSRYLKTRTLTLEIIGFNNKDRIYVNENLSPAARSLNIKALNLKREKKLASVYTKNGVVFVKKISENEGTPISSEDELNRLLQ